ncbi:MAG: flagellar type III secretion system protein FliR [Deltaproteobacteria bacterium]|nr:flagellar type III secretion system protein FliR [Deltaproteobacteria bacterium]HDM09884.1 flagellar type III secretion system protein FliR [Desulfobacteraceae bacterium]
MTVFNISLSQVQVFILIFLRVSAIIMTVPLFDSRNIPVLFKAGLSLSTSIILFSVVRPDNIPFITKLIPFGIGMLGEIILGVIIGLSVRLIFAGIQLAGQLVGYQMGFGIVNVMDPQTSAQVSVIAQLKYLIAMLIFLAVNAHHWFLRALVESFRLVPPLDFQFNNSLLEQLMGVANNMFVIAIKIGAPMVVSLLLTSVSLGLVARTVPQINIFIVAFPLKIAVGLLFLGLSLPYLSSFLGGIFGHLGSDILFLLRAM